MRLVGIQFNQDDFLAGRGGKNAGIGCRMTPQCLIHKKVPYPPGRQSARALEDSLIHHPKEAFIHLRVEPATPQLLAAFEFQGLLPEHDQETSHLHTVVLLVRQPF